MILIVVDFSLWISTPMYKFLATPWLCCRSFVRQHAWFILVLFLWCHILQTRIAKSSIGFPFSTLHLHKSLKSANTSLCLKFHLSPSHTSSKPEQLQSACNESSACRVQWSQMGLSIKFFRSDFVLLEGISYMHTKTSCPPPIEYSPQHPSPNPWKFIPRHAIVLSDAVKGQYKTSSIWRRGRGIYFAISPSAGIRKLWLL